MNLAGYALKFGKPFDRHIADEGQGQVNGFMPRRFSAGGPAKALARAASWPAISGGGQRAKKTRAVAVRGSDSRRSAGTFHQHYGLCLDGFLAPEITQRLVGLALDIHRIR